jgi:hypothetical protein
MQQGINMKLFKLTLLVLSVAMLLFSCNTGHNTSNMLVSTHKYINFNSADTKEELPQKISSSGIKESSSAFSRQ